MSKETKGELNHFDTLNNSTDNKASEGVNVNLSSKPFFDNRIACEWLSTKEAAYFLSISENALRILVHRGQVPVYKFGRRLRFRLKDCQALFEKKGAYNGN
jgi:excisionase family DNA binding protein